VNDRRRVLLIRLAIVLAALRFIIYPWIEYQADRRDALSVLTDRLDRAEGVVENRSAIETAAKALTEQSRATADRFTYAETIDRLRLDTQRRITEVVRANGLGVSLFDWLIEGNADATVFERDGFSFARVRIEFGGPLRQIATIKSELEGAFPAMVIRRVTLNFRDITTNIESGAATVSIIADVYFKLGSPPAYDAADAERDSDVAVDEPKPVPREAPGFSTVVPVGPQPAIQTTPGGITPGTVPLPRAPPTGIQPKIVPRGIAPPLGDNEEEV